MNSDYFGGDLSSLSTSFHNILLTTLSISMFPKLPFPPSSKIWNLQDILQITLNIGKAMDIEEHEIFNLILLCGLCSKTSQF